MTHAAYRDRVRMAELACAAESRFEVSRLEEDTTSYSIDTITKVRDGLKPGDALFFLIGADAFAEIESWKCWRDVVRAITFIVASRPRPSPAQEGSPARASPKRTAFRASRSRARLYYSEQVVRCAAHARNVPLNPEPARPPFGARLRLARAKSALIVGRPSTVLRTAQGGSCTPRCRGRLPFRGWVRNRPRAVGCSSQSAVLTHENHEECQPKRQVHTRGLTCVKRT